ncbi:MAG TPA: hypothetical protein VM450_02830 [Thermomicrobiales bacterium]|nr:hypothetical protein [Thermomicrobiales bacterium]
MLGAAIGLDDRQQRASRDANAAAERGAGIGMVLGAAVGYGGGWMIAPSLDRLAAAPAVALAFALAAAAVGMLVGSLLGLGRSADGP